VKRRNFFECRNILLSHVSVKTESFGNYQGTYEIKVNTVKENNLFHLNPVSFYKFFDNKRIFLFMSIGNCVTHYG
jgi:Mg2+ and Co2+ transporter CorA